MDVNQEISNFLRDAQYKLALITIEMDTSEDSGDSYYTDLINQRRELHYFYTILYETTQSLQGGYNWLVTAGWTDKEILTEIQYLRNKYLLNGLPVIDYAAITNKIAVYVIENDGVGSNVPPPNASGDILIGVSGSWVSGTLDEYAGMTDIESLNTYFAGRS